MTCRSNRMTMPYCAAASKRRSRSCPCVCVWFGLFWFGEGMDEKESWIGERYRDAIMNDPLYEKTVCYPLHVRPHVCTTYNYVYVPAPISSHHMYLTQASQLRQHHPFIKQGSIHPPCSPLQTKRQANGIKTMGSQKLHKVLGGPDRKSLRYMQACLRPVPK